MAARAQTDNGQFPFPIENLASGLHSEPGHITLFVRAKEISLRLPGFHWFKCSYREPITEWRCTIKPPR